MCEQVDAAKTVRYPPTSGGEPHTQPPTCDDLVKEVQQLRESEGLLRKGLRRRNHRERRWSRHSTQTKSTEAHVPSPPKEEW